jgi:hypothetical protein
LENRNRNRQQPVQTGWLRSGRSDPVAVFFWLWQPDLQTLNEAQQLIGGFSFYIHSQHPCLPPQMSHNDSLVGFTFVSTHDAHVYHHQRIMTTRRWVSLQLPAPPTSHLDSLE